MEYGAKKEEAAKVIDRSAARIEETGTQAATKTAGAMKQMAENIRGFNVNEYRDRMMDAVDTARTEVDKGVNNVKAEIQDHPFESVAVAAGAGILIGAFIAMVGRHAAKRAASRMTRMT